MNRSIAMLCLLWVSFDAHAADTPPNPLEAQLERLQALRAERPGDGLPVFVQAATEAQLGRREAALATLATLRGRRLGLIPSRGTGFDALWEDPGFQAIRATLMNEEERTAVAPVALTLGDPRLIPEGIAWDGARNRYLIGSIAQRKIVGVDAKGVETLFSMPGDGLDTVLGLHATGDRLYAVSTQFADAGVSEAPRNAVLVYDLARDALIARHAIAGARQLNDVTSAADGTVYCTDSAAGTLYRLRPGDKAFAVLGEAGALRGANGVAVSTVDGTVYVTLSTGIARVDPASGAGERMVQPDTVVTGGIDGLYWHAGALLGIQNWTNPGRVIRIELDRDGRSITGLRTLQSHHHPDFEEPTTGVVVGERLMVIANSQIARWDADREFKDAGAFKPPRVIAVALK